MIHRLVGNILASVLREVYPFLKVKEGEYGGDCALVRVEQNDYDYSHGIAASWSIFIFDGHITIHIAINCYLHLHYKAIPMAFYLEDSNWSLNFVDKFNESLLNILTLWMEWAKDAFNDFTIDNAIDNFILNANEYKRNLKELLCQNL